MERRGVPEILDVDARTRVDPAIGIRPVNSSRDR
jgi:hypothetical protein